MTKQFSRHDFPWNCGILLAVLFFGVVSCGHRGPKKTVTLPKPDTAQADRLVQEGIRLEEAGEYPKAIEAFTQAIAVVNDYPEAWLHRGRVELLRNDPGSALVYLQVAAGLQPENPQARHWRGDAFLRTGEPALALADYDKVIQLQKDSVDLAELYISRADAYRELRDIPKAIENYTQAIRRRPGSALPYVQRGLLLQKSNRVTEAVEDFSIAIALRPGYLDAYLARGNAYPLVGEHERARRDLVEASRLAPDSEETKLALKRVYEQLSELAQLEAAKRPAAAAVAAVSTPPAPTPAVAATPPPPATAPAAASTPQVAALVPTAAAPPAARPTLAKPAAPVQSAEEYWKTGYSLIQSHDYPKAIEQLDRAIGLRPGFALAFNARGYAWLRQRAYARAIADFDQALRLSPNYANAAHNRRVAMEAASRPKGAAPLAALSAEALRRAALDLIETRQYDKAVQGLDEAIRRKPDFAQAFNTRGFAWLLQRQYARAIADFDQALRLAPDYTNAAHNRRVALRVAGMGEMNEKNQNQKKTIAKKVSPGGI